MTKAITKAQKEARSANLKIARDEKIALLTQQKKEMTDMNAIKDRVYEEYLQAQKMKEEKKEEPIAPPKEKPKEKPEQKEYSSEAEYDESSESESDEYEIVPKKRNVKIEEPKEDPNKILQEMELMREQIKALTENNRRAKKSKSNRTVVQIMQPENKESKKKQSPVDKLVSEYSFIKF